MTIRAALLLSLLLTAPAPEAPVTTSIVGLGTTIGDVPLNKLGAWVLPFEDIGLWTLKTQLAVELRTNGTMLFVDPQVSDSSSPTFVVESVPRYTFLDDDGGAVAVYWRWRSLDLLKLGSIQVELRSAYSAGGVGAFRAIADLNGFGATPVARFQLSYQDSPNVSETFSEDYDPAAHRWVQIKYDPDAGKVRWQAGGPKWVTMLEVAAPSDPLALSDLRVFVSTSSDDAGADDPSAYFGPFNERFTEQSLEMPTTIEPLPVIGQESRVQLLTQIGDDPPENPEEE